MDESKSNTDIQNESRITYKSDMDKQANRSRNDDRSTGNIEEEEDHKTKSTSDLDKSGRINKQLRKLVSATGSGSFKDQPEAKT